ncbi:MAG: hypothetical protein VXW36_05695 [Candidatus Thermoplasmatota archaeon]|nr:hypothetical protein [Candidatus Thermoplasmatota archaeon]
MVKQSKPDEIALDDIMNESMKEMGKGEASHEEVVPEPQTESPKVVETKPQFGFKLGAAQTPDSFVVPKPKKEQEEEVKQQVILDKPSQGLDDDIIVDW